MDLGRAQILLLESDEENVFLIPPVVVRDSDSLHLSSEETFEALHVSCKQITIIFLAKDRNFLVARSLR